MIIVGEKINTSRKAVEPAVLERDTAFITELAVTQAAAGATYIDVNAGTLVSREPEALEWLVDTVQQAVDKPLCIDSPNPVAIERALKRHRGKAMINSITAEKERYQALLPLVRDYGCAVVALCMDDKGIPETAAERIDIAGRLCEGMSGAGIAVEDIFIDPMVRPISTGSDSALIVLEAIEEIMSRNPGVHTICGLSNVSYGLPQRKLLNMTFLVMAIIKGLDAAILDPNDDRLMSAALSAEALAGRDEYCMNYISASREGRLG